MKPLSNIEIKKLLYKNRYTKKSFRNVLSRGRLPKNIKTFPSFFIINSDYYDGKGVHWLVIAFFKEHTFFIDSFGLSPVYYNFPIVVKQGGKPLIQNTLRLQSFNSNACGYFAIYFIYFLSRGYSLIDILKHFSKTNRRKNDKYVYNFYKKLKYE